MGDEGGALSSPLVGEGGPARSAETVEGCSSGVRRRCFLVRFVVDVASSWSTPHPSCRFAAIHLLPQGEEERRRATASTDIHRASGKARPD